MLFVFRVSAEVEHESGLYVSRDEISDEISRMIDDGNPGTIDIDESTYDVTTWEITDISREASTT